MKYRQSHVLEDQLQMTRGRPRHPSILQVPSSLRAQPSRQLAPERAMRLVLNLLILESEGRQRELLARRRELQELSPAVYKAYMRTR
ncbi:hypothetical protein [Paraburkholderia tropica]|uniref:hypothetical protein n=1 Tax=Paraburkholderia tropica TaxID=92647 RepID=UPI002AB13ECB|nr:hypothetical protein [Paraburkholderia tropica]